MLVVHFTSETLQNFEPVNIEELFDEIRVNEEGAFEEVIKQHLISVGIKNGRKDEMVVFRSVELLSHSYLHAEGFYMPAPTNSGNCVGEKKGQKIAVRIISQFGEECTKVLHV